MLIFSNRLKIPKIYTLSEIYTLSKFILCSQIIKFDTVTLAFKIEKKLIKNDIVISHFNDRHNYNTRNANNLFSHPFRSNIGKFNTDRMIAVEFNSIPSYLRNSESLNILKKRLKIYLLRGNEHDHPNQL